MCGKTERDGSAHGSRGKCSGRTDETWERFRGRAGESMGYIERSEEEARRD